MARDSRFAESRQSIHADPFLGLLLAAVFSTSACAPLDSLPPPVAHRERWWEAKAASPTPTVVATPLPDPEPRCSVGVLDVEPSEPFDWIALVEVQGHGPVEWGDSALEAAKIQACRLGGDALVVIFRRSRARSGVAGSQWPPTTLPEAELRAAVIRYRRP